MREKIRLGSQHEKNSDQFIKKDLQAAIKSVIRRLDKLDAHISGLIASSDELKGKYKRLQLVKCVGPILSATLLAELPELGKINDKKIAALVGANQGWSSPC